MWSIVSGKHQKMEPVVSQGRKLTQQKKQKGCKVWEISAEIKVWRIHRGTGGTGAGRKVRATDFNKLLSPCFHQGDDHWNDINPGTSVQ